MFDLFQLFLEPSASLDFITALTRRMLIVTIAAEADDCNKATNHDIIFIKRNWPVGSTKGRHKLVEITFSFWVNIINIKMIMIGKTKIQTR